MHYILSTLDITDKRHNIIASLISVLIKVEKIDLTEKMLNHSESTNSKLESCREEL